MMPTRLAVLACCALLLLPSAAEAADWQVEDQGGRGPSLALDSVGPCTPFCGHRPPGVPPNPVIAFVDELLVRMVKWDGQWFGYGAGSDRLFEAPFGEAALALDPVAGSFERGIFRFAYTGTVDGQPQFRYAEGDYDEVYVVEPVEALTAGDAVGGLSMAVVPSSGDNLLAFERRVGSTAELVLARRDGGFESSGWTFQVLDSGPAPAGWQPEETSIALRADETAVVSYGWFGEMRVTGLPAVPDAGCASGTENDLVLTSAGRPQVAFLRTCSGAQTVAHAAWTGTQWTVTALTEAGTYSGPEIAFAPGESASFSYAWGGHGLVYRAGTTDEIVDAAANGETSLAIDASGNVHVAYDVPGGGRYASAPTGPLCGGRVPTITGTDAAETLTGTAGFDVILALGGDDKIDGLAGDDVLCGGAGADTIRGRAGFDDIRDDLGNDRIDGGGDADRIESGAGADRVTLGAGGDDLSAGAGNDVVTGGDGDDTVRAGAGNDRVLAGAGNDVVLGEAGADYLYGQHGDDQLFGGTEGDHLYGGRGNDQLDGGDGTDACRQDAGAGAVFNCAP